MSHVSTSIVITEETEPPTVALDNGITSIDFGDSTARFSVIISDTNPDAAAYLRELSERVAVAADLVAARSLRAVV